MRLTGDDFAHLSAGIIGAGFVGTIHARAIHATGARLAMVAESTPEAARAAAMRLGAKVGVESAEELIESKEVDVVHICTPNALHAPIAAAALGAGKHVVCEKPLATDANQAQHLATLAAESGSVATVPFVYRFYPMIREVRERVRVHGPGTFNVLHGSYLQDWLAYRTDTNWRVDPSVGGRSRAFADIGVHWCDLLEFTTGHRIVRLVARLATPVKRRGERSNKGPMIATEDVAVLTFDTDRGATGSLVVSQVSLGRKNRLWFSWDGSEAAYVFDQEQPEVLWVGGRHESRIVLRGNDGISPAAGRYAVLPAGHPQGYQDCFNAFVGDTYAAVLGDAPEGLPTFEDGRRAAMLTAAVLESAEAEAWAKVSE